MAHRQARQNAAAVRDNAQVSATRRWLNLPGFPIATTAVSRAGDRTSGHWPNSPNQRPISARRQSCSAGLGRALHAYYRQQGWAYVRTVDIPGRNSGALFQRLASPDPEARAALARLPECQDWSHGEVERGWEHGVGCRAGSETECVMTTFARGERVEIITPRLDRLPPRRRLLERWPRKQSLLRRAGRRLSAPLPAHHRGGRPPRPRGPRTAG